jgi:hypothetical protein
MTLDDLRRAVEAMPPGSSLTLPRDELLPAVREVAAAPAVPEQPETWMTAKEVGAMLGTSSRWAFDHQRELGGRKLSSKCVRFSSRAVSRYLNRRHA